MVFQRAAYSVGMRSVKDMPLELSGVVRESIVDGPGFRYAVFVQGCPHRCPGCHNPETHLPGDGYMSSTAELLDDITANPALDGVTFTGGEPFLWAAELAELARAVRDIGLSVIVYTGYTIEEVLAMTETDRGARALLAASEYIIEGRYIEEMESPLLPFQGSRNQRIFDVTCYPNRKEFREVVF